MARPTRCGPCRKSLPNGLTQARPPVSSGAGPSRAYRAIPTVASRQQSPRSTVTSAAHATPAAFAASAVQQTESSQHAQASAWLFWRASASQTQAGQAQASPQQAHPAAFDRAAPACTPIARANAPTNPSIRRRSMVRLLFPMKTRNSQPARCRPRPYHHRQAGRGRTSRSQDGPSSPSPASRGRIGHRQATPDVRPRAETRTMSVSQGRDCLE